MLGSGAFFPQLSFQLSCGHGPAAELLRRLHADAVGFAGVPQRSERLRIKLHAGEKIQIHHFPGSAAQFLAVFQLQQKALAFLQGLDMDEAHAQSSKSSASTLTAREAGVASAAGFRSGCCRLTMASFTWASSSSATSGFSFR